MLVLLLHKFNYFMYSGQTEHIYLPDYKMTMHVEYPHPFTVVSFRKYRTGCTVLEIIRQPPYFSEDQLTKLLSYVWVNIVYWGQVLAKIMSLY